MSAPTIIVYSLEQATAAVSAAGERGQKILILSAPGAASSMGAAVFKSLTDLLREEFPDENFTAAIDCGADAGHALAAIRQGIRAVVLSDCCPARERVADIARQNGAHMLSDNVYSEKNGTGPLDLVNCRDPLAACHDFLHINRNTQ